MARKRNTKKNRERQLKNLGSNFKQAEMRQQSINRLIKHKSKIKKADARELADVIVHKFSANGGWLSDKQWRLVDSLCDQ